MSADNFFDKFLIPYLEYEAALGYSGIQLRAEIDDLNIQPRDTVVNVGFNWGDSLIYLAEQFPDIGKIVRVDSSTAMIDLSRSILSDRELPPLLKEKISKRAMGFLETLHDTASKHHNNDQLYHCAAEDLDSLNIKADKIAATMGLHWLTDPEKAFTAFNRSLVMNGIVTFSTASSRFDVSQKDLLFHQNPYYQHFLGSFEELYSEAYRSGEEPTKAKIFEQKNLGSVIDLIERNGFTLEQYRELAIHVSEDDIDEVCIAGIKFRYDFDGREETIVVITKTALERAKQKSCYSSSVQQYEMSPIFRIRKIREI